MVATSKLAIALCLSSASGFAPASSARPALTLVKGDPNIVTDAGSNWKPTSGDMESTDTPDFFYEDDDERNADIDFKVRASRRDTRVSHVFEWGT